MTGNVEYRGYACVVSDRAGCSDRIVRETASGGRQPRRSRTFRARGGSNQRKQPRREVHKFGFKRRHAAGRLASDQPEGSGSGTGHAEAVQVWFDPSRLSYDDLLGTVWAIHNPTTRNRQGLDIGHQYRSAIFVHDAHQAAQVRVSLAEHQKQRRKAIVTEIVPAETFWKAEEHHKRYFEKQGRTACAVTLQQRRGTTAMPTGMQA